MRPVAIRVSGAYVVPTFGQELSSEVRLRALLSEHVFELRSNSKSDKPKVTRSTRYGEVGDWRWEAKVDHWDGGKYVIDSITAWNDKGEPAQQHLPREMSHDTLEELDREAETFVRSFLR